MKSNSGMGMRKHGRSGRSGKSPKLRLAMRREAEKDERHPKKYPTVASTTELFRKPVLNSPHRTAAKAKSRSQ